MDNEITFTEPETGEVCYIKDFPAFRPYHDEECDPGKFRYFLFDMDGDNAPELCIWDVETYIFKYDSKSETMTLWMEIPTYNEHVHGTKALSWDWDGVRYRFMRIDGEGKVVFEVYFLIEGFWSNGIVTYMMSMPFYDGKQVEMPEGMEKQGYFDEESDLYLFQVTEEQFDELTRDYFKALKESEEERGKVTYTYEELFGADDGVNAENGLWGTDGTPCMVTMVICHSVPSFMICVNSFMKRLL